MQWSTHAVDAVHRGMTHPDTLWYHQPFAARFLQRDTFTGLEGLGYAAARWFPFNGQLLHAMAAAPFSRDILSPLINLGWFALALLAAWCIGRPSGTSHLTLLAGAVVLGVPTLAGTQPGQASTDVACAALLLAAFALLKEGRLEPGPAALAGLAAGMAIGTKVTIAVPVAVLVGGYTLMALSRRRVATSLAWLLSVGVAGGFWYGRNWVLAGSPLPWFDLTLGPVHLPAGVVRTEGSLASGIGEHGWRDLYLPGLEQALGRAWPAVLVLGFVGAALALLRGRSGVDRVLGATVLLGAVGYAVTPLTGGLSFAFNLRYLTPALLLGAVIVPTLLPASRAVRHVLLVVLVTVLAVGATSRHTERVSAWPSGTILQAVAACAVLAAVGFGVHLAARRRLPVRLAASVFVVGTVLAGFWVVQDRYLAGRYVEAGLHMDDVHAHFRTVSDADVVVFGTDETFPMFGIDLSNRVRRNAEGRVEGADPCVAWRRALADRYDYVVLTDFGFSYSPQPDEEVIASDPAATLVVRDGGSVAFRIDGALDPGRCPTG